MINIGKSNETSFLDENYIQDYSTKFHELLKIIKKSKGPILIYSYYVWSGVIPLALFLEQNGIERYTIDNEQPLLNIIKINLHQYLLIKVFLQLNIKKILVNLNP